MRRLWCVAVLALGLAGVAAAAQAVGRGSIAGVVTAAATGAPLAGASVQVYEPFNPSPDVTTTSAADGSYQLRGLAAGDGYVVCVQAATTLADPRHLGYQSRCFRDTAWVPDRYTLPSGEPVSVHAGATTPDIDIALPPAAAIAGYVRDEAGQPVGGASVYVFPNPPGTMGFGYGPATSRPDGGYRVTGPPPTSAGYIVCFQAYATPASAPAGYLEQCYRNKTWSGQMSFPDGMTAAAARAGKVTRGIDAALRPAAGISGRVVDGRDGSPIAGIAVSLVGRGGYTTPVAATDAYGRYTIRGLMPGHGSERVCFGNLDRFQYPDSPTGYGGQCYADVPWAGRGPAPGGLTPVALQGGAFATADASLLLGGAVDGSVLDSHGAPVPYAAVYLYRSDGAYVVGVTVDSAGRYSIQGLPAGRKYVVCAAHAGVGECYRHVAWPGEDVPAAATRIDFAPGQVRTISFTIDPARPHGERR